MSAKDTVFLHIGMHKTATKSIQSGLKGFSDGKTRYADLGLANHSIPVMTAFRKDPTTHLYYRKRGISRDEARRLGKEYRSDLTRNLETPERNLIISGEELTRLTPSEVIRLRDFLEPYCDRIRVIAYIRDPVTYSSSAFQQVARHRQLTELTPLLPAYKIRFGKYIDTFGRDAIEFVPFTPEGLTDGNIITDFCVRTDIDPDKIPRLKKNTSLSTEVVALLLAWNRDGVKASGKPEEVKATSRMIALLRKTFPGKFLMHRELVEAELEFDDVEWMETTAGFPVYSRMDDADDRGIRSDDELSTVAEEAMPQLHELVESRGLVARQDRPAALLDALYTSILDSL